MTNDTQTTLQKKKENTMAWTEARFMKAVSWWSGRAYGLGHFNKELYQKVLKTKLNFKEL